MPVGPVVCMRKNRPYDLSVSFVTVVHVNKAFSRGRDCLNFIFLNKEALHLWRKNCVSVGAFSV